MRGGHGYDIVHASGHVRQALALTGLCEPESLYSTVTVPVSRS
jgi:hypothetical protein